MPADGDLHLIMESALAAGLLVHRTGGDTARSLDTMRRVALALGAEQADPVVSSMNVGLTIARAGASLTALRKAPHLGVDLAALDEVGRLVDAVEARRLDGAGLARRLEALAHGSPPYPVWLRVLGIGAAGACFAALFRGDAAAVLAAAAASAAGLALRLAMLARAFRPFAATAAAAALATAIAAPLAALGASPEAAVSASVLFLIPGVPLVNGTSDLLDSSPLNGVVRLASAAVAVLALVLGAGLALRLLQLAGLQAAGGGA